MLIAILLSLSLWSPAAEAGAVILRNGDVLHGVVTEAEGRVVVEHAVLGRVVLSPGDCSEVHPDGPLRTHTETETIRVRRAVDQALSMAVVPMAGDGVVRVAGAEPADPFDVELGAAASLASGNTDLFDLKLDGLVRYSRGRNTLESSLAYVYGEQDGDRSAENWHGKARFERRLSARAYAFAQALYDRDVFADIQHRVTAVEGLGWELAKSRRAALKAEVGGGMTFERRFGQAWMRDPSAYVGFDYTYKDPSGRKLVVGLDWLPNLNEFDLSRTILDMRLDQPVGQGIDLSLGVRLEHVINPPGAIKELDALLTAGFRLRL